MTTEKPIKAEINCETGEVTIDELTAEEIANAEKIAKDYEDRKAKEEADALAVIALKESAKAKLIAGEPLTEEEASVLVI